MPVPRVVLALVTAAALVGCGAVLGFEDVTYTIDAGDAGDAPDGAQPSDAAPSTDAPSGADATPRGDASAQIDASPGCETLILNPGFESKSTCDPWTSYGAQPSIDSTAHSGANACRACAGTGSVNLIPNLLAHSLAPGDAVHFEAWVRAADSALFAVKLELSLYTIAADTTSKSYLLSDTYQKMWVDHVVPPDAGTSANVEIFVRQQSLDPDAGMHECILIDDVVACVTRDGG